jgi:outer membrane receptor protein involved in Fe transport
MLSRALLFLGGILSAALHAQTSGAEIRLQVTDSSGAAMQAEGKVMREGGKDRSFRTDSQGRYTIANLPFGRYHVEISRAGFSTQTESIDVDSTTPVIRTVILSVGTQTVKLDVVAATPLTGSDLNLREIPAPVQTVSGADLRDSGALDLAALLNRRLNGVHINEVQENPFQPDVNYRGYTASPLLGTPEGISIYMDGVRLNQPFGDVVSWDLIPKLAIAEAAVMPGSNPLFGLNTLGGAVTLQTKDGRTQPGTSIQLSGGSSARRAVEFEHGGSSSKGLYWYVTGNLFHEDGWRVHSPSDVRQSFAKLGWQRSATTLSLTAAYAGNELTGNGLQTPSLLKQDYASVYTMPDMTKDRSPFLNFSARHNVSSRLSLAGNVYYRYIRADTFNGDLNENSLDQALYQPSAADIAALTAAGYTGFPTSGVTAANTPFPRWRCIAQALQGDEPAEKCNGLLNRTYTKQHNEGLSGQATWNGSVRGGHHQLTAGAAYDHSSVGFQQTSQLGYINPDRSITPVNAFGDGVRGGTVDGEPYDTRVDLHGRLRTWSLYAIDTLSIGNTWSFTFSGRYNSTSVRNLDGITPGGGPGSLDSRTSFDRFNPAAGLTYSPLHGLTAYFSFSEGSRAPTAIEIGCADPGQPCKLPNALAGDPPLDQVIARTWEAGVRGAFEPNWSWSAGWFRAENRNDILFVASTQTGFGYFKNFGRTRRQGLELDLRSRIRRLTLGAGYTYLDATYQTAEIINGASNATNSMAGAGLKGLDGVIQIAPGDRMPLIPSHMGKAFAVLQASSKASIDLGLIAVSSAYARGNENNRSQGDGLYYVGPGTSPGYAVINLGGRYRVQKRVELFVQVDNLLDRRYYSAAQLGPTGFTNAGTFLARPLPAVNGEFPLIHSVFYAPGAPRRAWAGLCFKF